MCKSPLLRTPHLTSIGHATQPQIQLAAGRHTAIWYLGVHRMQQPHTHTHTPSFSVAGCGSGSDPRAQREKLGNLQEATHFSILLVRSGALRPDKAESLSTCAPQPCQGLFLLLFFLYYGFWDTQHSRSDSIPPPWPPQISFGHRWVRMCACVLGDHRTGLLVLERLPKLRNYFELVPLGT